jgi:hypothetical protein
MNRLSTDVKTNADNYSAIELLKRQHPSLTTASEMTVSSTSGNGERSFAIHSDIAIEDPRVIKRLVHSLMVWFKLPYNDALPFILGYGYCLDNESALTLWVEEQLNELDINSPVVFSDLSQRLEKHLSYSNGEWLS